jgi:hypothetical protein
LGLKQNCFAIVARVDYEEVSAFVVRVEQAEQSGNWAQTQWLDIGCQQKS